MTSVVPDERMPIRALLVDYGEVLCHKPDAAWFEGMARIAGAELRRFTEVYWQLRPAYDCGELDGPAYWQLVGETVGSRIDAARTAELVERDIGLWANVDQQMLAWANGIAASGTPVGLLSNMVAEVGAHLRDTLGVFDRFTAVTYSYEVGRAKPDPRIYHRALDALGALPHETLFVDDRPVNVEAAQALGLHTHRFLGRRELVTEIDRLYAFVSGPV